MKLWLYGAGAVGGYLGSRLTQTGWEVCNIARGAHLNAMQANGLKVESDLGSYHLNPVWACSDEDLSQQAKPNAIWVSTKRHQNDRVIEVLTPLLNQPGWEEIPIFVIQNGLYSERSLQTAFGKNRVFRCVVYVAARIDEPGIINHQGGTKLVFDHTHPMAKTFQEMIDPSMIKVILCSPQELLQDYLWPKQLLNTSLNPITALLQQTPDIIIQNPDSEALFDQFSQEVIHVAKASGIELPWSLVDKHKSLFTTTYAGVWTSTQKDVDAGRPIEFDAILGDVLDEAKRLGVPVPQLQTLAHLLKAKEASYLSNTPVISTFAEMTGNREKR